MAASEYPIEFRRKIRSMIKKAPNGCWLWIGPRHPKGYGRVSYKGKGYYAHRQLKEMCDGKIPDGQEVHHKCRNPSCVNPAHLECVTHAENMRAAALAGAWSGKKNSNAKHTGEEVARVRLLHSLGVTSPSIEEIMGIPYRTVREYITNPSSWPSIGN